MQHDYWITIGEFAKEAGVSVRTLHFYEEQGLIEPNRDPANGRRRFNRSDLVRVQNITLLKKIGLSLRQIHVLSSQASPEIADVLSLQLDLLLRQKDELEEAIRSVQWAQTRVGHGQVLTMEELCHLIRMTEMNVRTREDLYRNYLTDAQFEVIAKGVGDHGFGWENDAAWGPLVLEGERLLGLETDDPAVQDLAKRWWGLLWDQTGGDMDLLKNLKTMYDQMEMWPEEIERPFNPELRDFINDAVGVYMLSLKDCA
ncbi:MerR family transcriptional regulator [Aestuariispira insulae]|uniref:MerR family transcriptional regulator n=1 Tax=Aestuariispira insulae TaxID=1461337 RepID=A0A3D9HPI3_9PROT|nr:MerR family transcriptional regulator [Aestuariispira insulae]RED51382.1 MerR family transcriptional regulator [Aestuariispira insulae]